jgi:transketolase
VRRAFIATLVSLAERDERIVLMTGDLGYTVVEPFATRFPDRFVNAGVAEQNMVGMATGLAEAGMVPFVYSIVTFATLRPYEFIRNGAVMHGLPVRIVGIGGGMEYSHEGATHYGLEDVGLLRMQPGLSVVVPADAEQAASALAATWDRPGPVYYRLGKSDTLRIPGLGGAFDPDRANLLRPGEDVAILAMGPVAAEAVAAADLLLERGIRATVAVVPQLNPGPDEDLAALLGAHDVALTVEAHYVVGGLGSHVAELVAERGIRARLVRCGVRGLSDGTSGSLDHFAERHGFSAEAIADSALEALCRTRAPRFARRA